VIETREVFRIRHAPETAFYGMPRAFARIHGRTHANSSKRFGCRRRQDQPIQDRQGVDHDDPGHGHAHSPIVTDCYGTSQLVTLKVLTSSNP
jgi:hypothetical protein